MRTRAVGMAVTQFFVGGVAHAADDDVEVAGMIFIPSRDGISHSPLEFSE